MKDLDELNEKFISAYDAWVAGDELCGGELFDAMLTARAELQAAQNARAEEMAHL